MKLSDLKEGDSVIYEDAEGFRHVARIFTVFTLIGHILKVGYPAYMDFSANTGKPCKLDGVGHICAGTPEELAEVKAAEAIRLAENRLNKAEQRIKAAALEAQTLEKAEAWFDTLTEEQKEWVNVLSPDMDKAREMLS